MGCAVRGTATPVCIASPVYVFDVTAAGAAGQLEGQQQDARTSILTATWWLPSIFTPP